MWKAISGTLASVWILMYHQFSHTFVEPLLYGFCFVEMIRRGKCDKIFLPPLFREAIWSSEMFAQCSVTPTFRTKMLTPQACCFSIDLFTGGPWHYTVPKYGEAESEAISYSSCTVNIWNCIYTPTNLFFMFIILLLFLLHVYFRTYVSLEIYSYMYIFL